MKSVTAAGKKKRKKLANDGKSVVPPFSVKGVAYTIKATESGMRLATALSWLSENAAIQVPANSASARMYSSRLTAATPNKRLAAIAGFRNRPSSKIMGRTK